MMAHDVGEGLPASAPEWLRTIFDALMPPDTIALTAKLVERLPDDDLPLFLRGLLIMRKTMTWLRMRSSLFAIKDHDYLNGALRKRIIHDEVVATIEQGAEQVLVLGAGHDVLCLQLQRKYPHVLFVEVDQPNTQRIKRKAISEVCGGAIPANHAFVSVDFRYQSLETELGSQLNGAWQPQCKSIAIVEGVWPYLTEEAIRASLREFRKISAAGSAYVFTYFVLSGTPMQQRIVAASAGVFALVSEPVRYLPTSKQQIEALLHSEGYESDMSAKRTNGYVRYIVPGGFQAYVKPEHILSNFIGVAKSRL